MKDGVNPLRPSHIECTGPSTGENVTMRTNLPSQGDPQLLSRWSDPEGSRYRSGVGLIAGSTARVRRTSASALTATMFSRDRGRLPTAGRAYRRSDENGYATAGLSAPTWTAGVAVARADLASSEEMTRIWTEARWHRVRQRASQQVSDRHMTRDLGT